MTIEDTNRTYAKQKAKVKYIHSLEAMHMSMAGKTEDLSLTLFWERNIKILDVMIQSVSLKELIFCLQIPSVDCLSVVGKTTFNDKIVK